MGAWNHNSLNNEEGTINMRWFCLLCLVFAMVGCRTAPAPVEKPQKVDEASFVDDFLRKRFSSSLSEDAPLVIMENLSLGELMTGKNMESFTNDLLQHWQSRDAKTAEALRDFCAKNSGESTIDAIGALTVPHIVVTSEQMNRIFRTSGRDGWEVFYETYPKSPGIVTLSRPGFSADGTAAVIYMGNQYGWLAGHGQIYVFHRVSGKWEEGFEMIGPRWVS